VSFAQAWPRLFCLFGRLTNGPIFYRESYTSSLLSSVRNYQFENGRRYHGYREGSEWEMRSWVVNDNIWLTTHVHSVPATKRRNRERSIRYLSSPNGDCEWRSTPPGAGQKPAPNIRHWYRNGNLGYADG
jgi:hypothetical protein